VREVFEAVLQAEASGEPAALVTVVSTEGSTPQRAGAKMVVFGDGRLVGTIGGGCVEAEMARCARRVMETRQPETASYDLTPDEAGEDGLICGGRMRVFIEPIEGAPTLCLFGAGHVAQPLAEMARRVGFRVEVADDRIKFANAERFPGARIVVAETFSDAARQMTLAMAANRVGMQADGEFPAEFVTALTETYAAQVEKNGERASPMEYVTLSTLQWKGGGKDK
jgi:xanthine dehydrogenase accessory factor